MRREPGIVSALLLISLAFSPISMEAQGSDSMNSGNPKSADREMAGLKGPVRSVIEERTYSGSTDADGKAWPELKTWNKTEYDRDSRVAAKWWRNTSREHGPDATDSVARYTYDAAGRLARRSLESEGKTVSEVNYQYDDKGRLQSITNSEEPDNPIAFRYDANGRKSKIAIAHPLKLPEGGAVSASTEYLFETESKPVALPDGGSATTIYDEHDRPTEIQCRNANGELVSRTFRYYDEKGHVVMEKQMMDDPLSMMPAAERKKIFDSGKVTSEELRAQFAEFLGGSEMWSVKYVYDAQGRRTQTIHTTLNHMDDRTETSYDEHGDVAKEVSQQTIRGSGNPDVDGTHSSETIYSYEYDSYGNWTVKKRSSRSLPDGTFKDSGDQARRTIEYF